MRSRGLSVEGKELRLGVGYYEYAQGGEAEC